MNKKKVYVSGKISGLDLDVARSHFENKEFELVALGHEVINPMKLVPYHPDLTLEDYMIADIKALFSCHEMHMLPNWKESRGARIEHAIAIELSLNIIYHK
jgi:hypothetical protein